MNATDMSFTFSASNPGTYYVPYTITQGSIPDRPARIEVQAVTGDLPNSSQPTTWHCSAPTTPQSWNHCLTIADPMGGVLSVTSVTADAASASKPAS